MARTHVKLAGIATAAVLVTAVTFRIVAERAQAATPPTPTYGTAVVDGNPSEWNLASDFYAPMYTAGDPSKPILANGYLRYDCATNTLYVLVLQQNYQQQNAVPLLSSPTGNAWAEIDGSNTKEYTDTSGNDGTPPDFAWVGLGYSMVDSTYAQGYEASFSLSPGSYTIVVHVEALSSGMGATAAFVGFNTHTTSDTIPLDIVCGAGTATPSQGPPGSPSSTPSSSPTGSPTGTPTDTPPGSPTGTAAATASPSSTPTGTASNTAGSVATATPTPIDTPTNTAAPTRTPTATLTATATPTKTPLGQNGAPCTSGGQCLSMNCVDQVCCDTMCTAPDHACNLPGREGTCLPIGTAPAPVLSGIGKLGGIAVLMLIAGAGLYRSRRRD